MLLLSAVLRTPMCCARFTSIQGFGCPRSEGLGDNLLTVQPWRVGLGAGSWDWLWPTGPHSLIETVSLSPAILQFPRGI